ENDIVRVDTTLVTVPVSVVDRQGRFIPNLKKEDFKLSETASNSRLRISSPPRNRSQWRCCSIRRPQRTFISQRFGKLRSNSLSNCDHRIEFSSSASTMKCCC